MSTPEKAPVPESFRQAARGEREGAQRHRVRDFCLGLVRHVLRIAGHAPASLIALICFWVVHFAVGPQRWELQHALGAQLPFTIDDWQVVLSGTTSASLTGLILSSIAILLLGVPAEMLLRTPRFIVVALLTHLVVTPAGLMVAYAVQATGLNRWSTDLSFDTALSPIGWIFGVSAISTALMTTLWSRRITTILIGLVGTLVLFSGSLADFISLAAVVGGLVVAQFLKRRAPMRTHPALPGHGVSTRERRILVSVLLTAVAMGPVVAGLNPGGGPFSQIGQIAWSPEIITQSDDLKLLTQLTGLGPVLGNLMPLVVQLVIYYGLSCGRRLAWWLALICQVAAMVTVWLTVMVHHERFEASLGYTISLFFLLLPWVICLVVLLISRAHFSVRIHSARLGRFALFVLAAVAITGVLWCFGALLLRHSFRPVADIAVVLSEWPLRYLPPVLYDLIGGELTPTTVLTRALFSGIAVIFWLVVSVLLFRLLGSVPDTQLAADRARAREIMSRGTGDHLQAMGLWQGNRYWFYEPSPDVEGFVAYRVHYGVAVTVGEPVVTDTAVQGEMSTAFEHFAISQGWQPAWYSVRREFAEQRAANGFSRVHVAEESILDTDDLEFKGKKFQNIRTARNRAGKEGVRAVWTTWQDAGPLLREAMIALSEQWVAEKSLPEMGFTLGTVEELGEEGTKLLLAVDDEDRLHGITSWLPVYEHGHLAGYTLDVMRRDATGFRPVIEFLLAEGAEQARSEGLGFVSLSGAPLARTVVDDSDASFLDAALEKVGASMEPLYGFRQLAASKYKFHPKHESWYLAYADELALPAIGLAVSTCYLPHLRPRDAVRALRIWAGSTS